MGIIHGLSPDAAQGPVVCGDFLGGGRRVEGAWLSAQILSVALLQPALDVHGASTARGAAEPDPPAGVSSESTPPSQVSLMTLVAPGTALATSAQIQAPLDEKDAKKFLKLHRAGCEDLW